MNGSRRVRNPKPTAAPSKTLSLLTQQALGPAMTWSTRGAKVRRAAALTPWLCMFKHCLSSAGSFNRVQEGKKGRVKLPGKGDTTGEADIAESSLENHCLIFLLSKMSLKSFLHPSMSSPVLTQSYLPPRGIKHNIRAFSLGSLSIK